MLQGKVFRKLKTKAMFSLYQQKDVHGIYVADGYAASIESEINEHLFADTKKTLLLFLAFRMLHEMETDPDCSAQSHS